MTRTDISHNNRIVAETSWIYRLLTFGPKCVSITGDTLRVERPFGNYSTEIPVGAIDSITLCLSWFWHRLTIRLGIGTELSVGGLDEEKAKRVREAAIGEAERIAELVSPRLKQLDERLRRQFSGNRYARYGESQDLHSALAQVLLKCKGLIRRRLDQEAAAALTRLETLESFDKFESVRRQNNSLYISNTVPSVKEVTQETLKSSLTKEQAEAVATDEDVTMVLAGAGTGNTAVIVGKVVHLIRNQGVRPDEVLVLAFNRKAAEEVRRRLKGDLSATHVHTFHSFGLRVIAEAKAAPTISKLAEDEIKLRRAINGILSELLNDPEQSKAVINFILYHNAPYRSAFDFDTYEQYDEYIHDIELRTLSGDLVKSFEELEIANYLTEHGIEFRYEESYEVNTANQSYRQYQPDFFLPEYDIYVEHFAVDKQGRPPSGWTGYAEGVEWKRQVHRQRGSTLVETYSWQHRERTLLETLRGRLEEEGVCFNQMPRPMLVRRLTKERVS